MTLQKSLIIMKKLILILVFACSYLVTNAQWQTNVSNGSDNAAVSLSNPTSQLQIGMSSCTGCYSGQASTSDAVFRVLGGGNILFSIPTNNQYDSRKIIFSRDDSKLMQIAADGKVAIGNVSQPGDYKLYVESGILTEKLKVSLKYSSDWADYVFDKHYKLMPLRDVENYIIENKHLPNVASASQVQESGIDVAKMDAKLLEKIEELTLYIIQLNKRIEKLEREKSSVNIINH
jgi:hypothetical protein